MIDLKQKTAKDISDIIPKLMQVFVSYIKDCGDSNFPMAHFRIVGMLSAHPMKISDLALGQKVSKASISDSVKIMVEKGWIQKYHDPNDKRIVMLKLSHDGVQFMEEMREKVREYISIKLEKLSDEQLEKISQSLNLLDEAFSDSQHGGLH
jgi:DNA-binding MarR family transcriptional regulator